MTRVSRLKRPITTGFLGALAVLVLGCSAPAKAGSNLDVAPSDSVDLDARPKPERSIVSGWTDGWTLKATLGAGVVAAPRFQGAEKYEAQPVPLVDVTYGPFFAKTGEGIGVNVIETPTFTAGANVNWMKGYDGKDVSEGIDDVDSALGARLFVSARFKGAIATLVATQAVTETDRGLLVNASLAYPVHATERLTIIPSLGASWANDKYMNGYFGVDPSEASASGLNRYEPTGGFKDVSFRVSAKYRITDGISAVGSVGVTHLLGEAADSPIVEQKTQPIVLMGLTYTF